jgi:hypothetical protein
MLPVHPLGNSGLIDAEASFDVIISILEMRNKSKKLSQ